MSEFVNFTPRIVGTAGDPMFCSSQQGYANKTGLEVKFQIYIQFANWAPNPMTGPLTLLGLPYPTRSIPVFASAECWYTSNLSPEANPITSVFLYAGGASSIWGIYGRIAGQNPRQLTAADVNLHSQFIIKGWYFCA